LFTLEIYLQSLTFLDPNGRFFGLKQLLSWSREAVIARSVNSSLDALGEKDLMAMSNQVNQRRTSRKPLLE
jgi:hypothetical protein